jgi:transcriptional regulator GlxA family with amidase domain
MKIAILLYEGVDLLDSGGPYEVFLTASRLALRDASCAPFEVVTVTLDGGAVAAYGGLGLTPHASLGAVMPADVLIVPGTIDIDGVLANKALLDAVSNFAGQQGNLVASVCTGAFVLAEAGLLAGREWTTHWEDIDLLAERLGADGARRGVRWVDSGEIVTAAGLSSGIAMALHLVDRFAGRELAERTAAQIDYEWTAVC